MKLGKIKSLFIACLMLAALVFGFFAANGAFVYAEQASATGNGFSLTGSEGSNFIYSAEFTPESESAKTAGMVFGVDDGSDCYWMAVADVKENTVVLWQSESAELKTAEYQFEAGKKFKMTVVVNSETAKIFVGSSDVAVITCKLEDYHGGKLGLAVKEGEFSVTNVTFTDTDTLDGDIFCNGYDVLKVVNLTDGNYKLNGNEYSMKGGVLTVSRDYLKTLEANTEYVFRVVTSFTDFNFSIITDFTAVTATPSIEKYYRHNDVTLELSGNVTVHKLLIDGKECAFTQSDGRVVISSTEISSLTTGKHTVKLYTNKGRPEATINVSEMVETVSEPVVKASHMWLWIDVAIFGTAIIGYVAYSIISKSKKK